MLFSKSQRLHKQADFFCVRKQGTRVHASYFIFQLFSKEVSQDEKPVRRLGVIASRKVGNAVKRNRGKRIMRELFRLHQDKLPESCDLVIVLFSQFDEVDYWTLEAKFLDAIARVMARGKVLK